MKKGKIAERSIIGFLIMTVGAGLISFTPYKGAGGIIIAIGIAIATGLR